MINPLLKYTHKHPKSQQKSKSVKEKTLTSYLAYTYIK